MVSTRQHRSKSSKAKSLEVAESSDSDFIPTSPSRTAKMAQRSPFGAAPVAPFIIKTYEMVNDPATDHIISWTPDGASFTVTSTETFSKELLPRHFKHNNFSSFVRQLNTYRFRKIDPESWTFKNEYFVRGRPDQLGLIVRKTTDGPKAKGGGKSPASSIQPALEVGAYGGTVRRAWTPSGGTTPCSARRSSASATRWKWRVPNPTADFTRWRQG